MGGAGKRPHPLFEGKALGTRLKLAGVYNLIMRLKITIKYCIQKFNENFGEYKILLKILAKKSIVGGKTPLFCCWFSHDVTKIQTEKPEILLRFYFHDALEQLNTNFRFKRVLGFLIEYAWISKLLRDAAFTWRPRELSCRLKKWLISGNFAI